MKGKYDRNRYRNFSKEDKQRLKEYKKTIVKQESKVMYSAKKFVPMYVTKKSLMCGFMLILRDILVKQEPNRVLSSTSFKIFKSIK